MSEKKAKVVGNDSFTKYKSVKKNQKNKHESSVQDYLIEGLNVIPPSSH